MSFILPHLEYGSWLFTLASDENISKLDRHYRGALFVSGCLHGSNANEVLKCLGWMSLADRRNEKLLILMSDNEHNMVPSYISQIYNSYLNHVINAN
jgi:hypothetical protein